MQRFVSSAITYYDTIGSRRTNASNQPQSCGIGSSSHKAATRRDIINHDRPSEPRHIGIERCGGTAATQSHVTSAERCGLRADLRQTGRR